MNDKDRVDVELRHWKAVFAVRDELHAQDVKWGDQRLQFCNDWHRANTILVEEVGEVAKAICDGDFANLRLELVQVAAVACAMLEALDVQSR